MEYTTNQKVLVNIEGTIEFFQRQRIYAEERTHEEMYKNMLPIFDETIGFLFTLIYKQIYNTAVMLGVKPTHSFILSQGMQTQLTLPFHEAKIVEGLNEIKDSVTKGHETIQQATERVSKREIGDCRVLFNEYCRENPDALKTLNKNEILRRIWELTHEEESKRFDPFDAIRRIVYTSFCANSYSAMVTTATSILNANAESTKAKDSVFAVEGAKWTEEEILQFCGQTIYIHKEKLNDLTKMMDPLSNKVMDQTKPGQTAIHREARVLSNKALLNMPEETIYQVNFKKIDIKSCEGATIKEKRENAKALARKATENELSKIESSSRKEALSLKNKLSGYYGTPYKATIAIKPKEEKPVEQAAAQVEEKPKKQWTKVQDPEDKKPAPLNLNRSPR